MKKITLVFLTIVLLAPGFSYASIDHNLKYGARGQEVNELQEYLIDKGFLVYNGILGNFYRLTQKAVIAFQGSVGLPKTGYVGPLTRAVINAELAQNEASSTEAEIAETGTTSPPTTQIPAIPVVIQPSSPAYTPPPQDTPPVLTPSVPVRDPSVASKLAVYPRKTEVIGANCELAQFNVAVLDQYGDKMTGMAVSMTLQNASSSVAIIAPSDYNGSNGAYFSYTPQSTSTRETVAFSSGSLSETAYINTREGLNRDKITNEGGRWLYEGFIPVNPVTLKCL